MAFYLTLKKKLRKLRFIDFSFLLIHKVMECTSETLNPFNAPLSFSFIESSHKGRILVKAGRRHYLKRINKKSKTSIWSCDKKSCNGILQLNSAENEIIRVVDHGCAPDYKSVEIEKKKY